jgi:hypothetical protein
VCVMTEQTVEKAQPKLSLDEYFSQTGLPPEALKVLTDKVSEHNDLVIRVNKWIAQVNAAKAQDPSNVDYLDTLWKREQESGNSKVKDLADEFDAIAEQYEAKLKELREIAKANFIPEQLSEEKTKEVKAQVNSAQPTIAELRNAIKAQMMIPESILNMKNVPLPEGGLVSLLPQADTLKSKGGRKAASGNVSYMTRVGDVLIDGESTQVNGKGKFNYAADKLSERFGARTVHPANAVTAEELEEAYYKHLNVPLRSLSSGDEFTFTKETVKPNPNDGELVKAPVKVTLTVISPKAIEKASETAKPETPKAETAPANEAPKAETPKPETPEVKSAEVPAPANAPAAKKATPAKK